MSATRQKSVRVIAYLFRPSTHAKVCVVVGAEAGATRVPKLRVMVEFPGTCRFAEFARFARFSGFCGFSGFSKFCGFSGSRVHGFLSSLRTLEPEEPTEPENLANLQNLENLANLANRRTYGASDDHRTLSAIVRRPDAGSVSGA